MDLHFCTPTNCRKISLSITLLGIIKTRTDHLFVVIKRIGSKLKVTLTEVNIDIDCNGPLSLSPNESDTVLER